MEPVLFFVLIVGGAGVVSFFIQLALKNHGI